MKGICIKSANKPVMRLLFSMVSVRDFSSSMTIRKKDLYEPWGGGRGRRLSVCGAINDLPNLRFELDGEPVELFKAVFNKSQEVTILLNKNEQTTKLWQLLTQAVERLGGIDSLRHAASRHTFSILIAHATSGSHSFSVDELRRVTGCEYQYRVDAAFVRDVIGPLNRDLSKMGLPAWGRQSQVAGRGEHVGAERLCPIDFAV
ncbi:hypothetical protein ACP3V3_02600 [Vibrio sp. PNB22_3_1]